MCNIPADLVQYPTIDSASQCLVCLPTSNLTYHSLSITYTDFKPIAPLPLESDVESIAEDIPSTAPEPSIAKEEPIDTKMKEEEDEEEVDEEDGETYDRFHRIF